MALALLVVLVLVAVLVHRITGSAEESADRSDDGSGPSASAVASTGTGAEPGVKLGVFRSTSPTEVTAFGDWLGRDVDYVVDFSRRATWDDIANPTDQLSAWQDSGHRIVYGLAMLPENDDLDVSLAAGATGAYNDYYRTLAENLVAYGQGNAILRLGWEFNLSSWRWHPDDAQAFVEYWRQVVTTMRSVPGTDQLQFDWNVNNGGDSYDSTVFYPGDDYVDYVGVDVYDISWADDAYPYPDSCDSACRLEHQKAAWQNIIGATYGLSFWSKFAAQHSKPLSLPEWGLWDRPDGHGGADDPYFIEQMHAFIDDPANNVAYQAYFQYDVGSSGNHLLTAMPESQQVFLELFGG